MPNSATTFPIRWRRRPFARPCSIGMRARRREGRERLALVRELLAIAAQGDRAASCAARHSARRDAATGRADARIGGSATAARLRCSPISRTSRRARPPTLPAGASDLGRRAGGQARRPGRCTGASERDDAARGPDRDLSPAAHAELRLRRAAAARALSQGARHQPSLRLALPEGARRQHPWLRHRRPQRAQSRARRRGRLSRGCARRSPRPTSGSSSISCPTTWACITPTMPGGSTCWNGGRSRLMPASFDIDWETLPGTAARRRAAADPRTPLRRGAGERRDRAALRSARREFLRLVLRASAADRAEPLWRDSAARSWPPPAPSDEPAGRRLLELAARYRGPRNPPRDQAPALQARAGRGRGRQAR